MLKVKSHKVAYQPMMHACFTPHLHKDVHGNTLHDLYSSPLTNHMYLLHLSSIGFLGKLKVETEFSSQYVSKIFL